MMTSTSKGFYEKYVKRSLDLILSLIALIILSPIILIVAILVRTKLGSPVLFKQNRPGLNDNIFTMYKFRTMTNERDEYGDLLPNDERHTKFGKFLRSVSLDELPELLNILKGDMSIIGPRPLLVEYLQLYNDYERRRHEVRPGLSGLAQVSGRNAITWEDKFSLDVHYVDNISFKSDIKIVFLTIRSVFKREGIQFHNDLEDTKFKGHEKQRKRDGA